MRGTVYKIICPQKIRERSLEKKEVCITARYIGGLCQNPGSQWVFLFFLFCNEGNPNGPLLSTLTVFRSKLGFKEARKS